MSMGAVTVYKRGVHGKRRRERFNDESSESICRAQLKISQAALDKPKFVTISKGRKA